MKKLLFLSFSIVLSFLVSAQKGGFYFIENKGQINDEGNTTISKVKYYTESSGVKIFLTNTGIIYQWEKYNNLKPNKSETDIFSRTEQDSFSIETYKTNITLLGANPNPIIETYDVQKSYLNFYLPQCTNGALNVKHYKKLVYRNVYNGIDWVWKFTEEGIKYDFIVHTGADYKQIQLQFDAKEKPTIDAEGNLKLENILGTLTEKAPITYSDNRVVESSFQLQENILSLAVGDYNHNKTLIIDPSLIWGRYVGGFYNDNIWDITTDTLGNNYICGQTLSQYFASVNVHQTIFGGDRDAFISKLDSNGVLLWTTYLGGSGRDRFFSIAVDKALNIYSVGNTSSQTGLTKNGHQNVFGGGVYDALIAKFTNSGLLTWCSYYGGTGNDDLYSITIDNSSNVYTVGITNSYNGNSIESTGFNFSSPYKDYYNKSGLFAKFNSAGTRLFGAYFGGDETTELTDVKVDNSGNIYLTGSTENTSGISFNAPQSTNKGEFDAFVAKLNFNFTRQWVTYFGGEKADFASKIALDDNGNVFLAGLTRSKTGIYHKGHSSKFVSTLTSYTTAGFIAKFNTIGTRVWSTYYSDGGYARSIDVDSKGDIYAVGTVKDFDLQAEIAYKGFKAGTSGFYKSDGYIVKFNTKGERIWGSFYGGTESEELLALAINKKNNTIYAAGITESNYGINYSTYSKYEGKRDGFIIKVAENINDTLYKSACEGDSIALEIPDIVPNSEVRWIASSSPGGPLLHKGNKYTFLAKNSTTVWAYIFANNDANVIIGIPKYINVEGTPLIDFSVNDSLQCLNANNFKFTNNSSVLNGNLNNYWLFGSSDTSTQKNPTFSFNSAKKHSIKLLVKTDLGCSDSLEKLIEVAPEPTANFNSSLISFLLCEKEKFKPINQSSVATGSLSYLWDFGNMNTDTMQSPTYVYNTQGNYSIKLTTTTDKGCTDSINKNAIVNPLPTNNNTILGNGSSQRNTQQTYYLLNTKATSQYNWNAQGGNIVGASFGDSVKVAWGLGATGIVSVIEENKFACADTVALKAISLLNTGIENINAINYSIYPIPANNVLLLKVNTKVAYTITDVLGKEVANGIALPSTENSINTSLLNNGVYLLQLHNANNVIATQKIVVRR